MEKYNNPKTSTWLKYLILVVCVFFLWLYHQFGYIGHYGYDDMQYATIANDLLNGQVNYNDHYSFRFPIIAITALSYKIFGINDFASSLPSMLISVFTLLLVFFTLYRTKIITIILGLSLTLFSGWYIFYSDKLMPDIYIAFSVMMVVFAFYWYKYQSTKKYPLLYAIWISFALLFGFLAKETIILIVPLIVYVFIVDLIYNQDRKFWVYLIVIGFIMLVGHFAFIQWLTGDFMQRFNAIVENSYLNMCSYDKQSTAILLKRLFYDFFKMMSQQGLFTSFIFLLPLFLYKKSWQLVKLKDSFSFFTISAIILLLSSNFMTISYKAYVPLCVDPRHYLFLIPVAAIPATMIITEMAEERKNVLISLVATLIVAFLAYFQEGNSFLRLYLPLTIVFIVFYLVRFNKNAKVIFVVLFLAALALSPIESIIYAQKVKYNEQKEIVKKYILSRNDKCYIITSEVQKRLGSYYYGFKNNPDKQFLSYSKFNPDTLDGRTKLLYLNWYTQYLSGLNENDLPYYAKTIDSSYKKIYENNELHISIYELDSLIIPQLSNEIVFASCNYFESKSENWLQNETDITEQVKFEGGKSNKVNEFSSTLEIKTDSLLLVDFSSILISTNVYCNFQYESNARLILSIEKDNKSYFWKELYLNKYIKAYSNWWPVNNEITVKTAEIKPSSTLKIYIWNPSRDEIFIDNFCVKIIGLPN